MKWFLFFCTIFSLIFSSVHPLWANNSIAQWRDSCRIEAKIELKTEPYIQIPESMHLKRETFHKNIHHIPHYAEPFSYTDELMDRVIEKIWWPEKKWTEVLTLLEWGKLYPEDENIPVRVIGWGLRINYSIFEKLSHDENYWEDPKKDFNFLLKFFEKYPQYDNISASQKYIFQLPQWTDSINIKVFPFDAEDIFLHTDNSFFCEDDTNHPQKFFVPKLFLSTPYFDVRNLSIYLNKEESVYEEEYTDDEVVEEDMSHKTLDFFEGLKVLDTWNEQWYEDENIFVDDSLLNVTRKYYAHVYHYKTESGQKFSVPALLPYYVVRYTLTNEDKQKAQHTLRVHYTAHTLENLYSIDNSVLKNP